MIFVIGPLFSGKQEYICKALKRPLDSFSNFGIRDVHELAAKSDNLEELAEKLAEYEVVIATEIGGGVVPIYAEQRENRERAGRLSCLLAERADAVVRVCCGLPQVLKGKLP